MPMLSAMMRRGLRLALALLVFATLASAASPMNGKASYYGPRFHGRRTASSERFNMYHMTAAHKTLPFGTYVRVTRPDTGDSVVVRINDRGPYVAGRIIDLSCAAAEAIGMMFSGVVPVKLEVVEPPADDVMYFLSSVTQLRGDPGASLPDTIAIYHVALPVGTTGIAEIGPCNDCPDTRLVAFQVAGRVRIPPDQASLGKGWPGLMRSKIALRLFLPSEEPPPAAEAALIEGTVMSDTLPLPTMTTEEIEVIDYAMPDTTSEMHENTW